MTTNKQWRTERFNLSSDGLSVVIPHPQAKTARARQMGTVVLKFEAWTTLDFRQAVVDQLNAAAYPAVAVDQRSVDHYADKIPVPTCRPGVFRAVKTPAGGRGEAPPQPSGTMARAYRDEKVSE